MSRLARKALTLEVAAVDTVYYFNRTFKMPNMSAADDKFCDIICSFPVKIWLEIFCKSSAADKSHEI